MDNKFSNRTTNHTGDVHFEIVSVVLATAPRLALWPLEYRAGIEVDCHLPAFCRSVSSVPAWSAEARTLRPTCPSEIPKTRACGSR